MNKKEEFRNQVKNLININSLENGSNTPDFIIANYLVETLELFNKTINARKQYYLPSIKSNFSRNKILLSDIQATLSYVYPFLKTGERLSEMGLSEIEILINRIEAELLKIESEE